MKKLLQQTIDYHRKIILKKIDTIFAAAVNVSISDPSTKLLPFGIATNCSLLDEVKLNLKILLTTITQRH